MKKKIKKIKSLIQEHGIKSAEQLAPGYHPLIYPEHKIFNGLCGVVDYFYESSVLVEIYFEGMFLDQVQVTYEELPEYTIDEILNALDKIKYF